MPKTSQEWFDQAQYDLDTARVMLEAGRHFYAIFMCHLALEKALKGLYLDAKQKAPPRTHNLIFLAHEVGLELPTDLSDFIFGLNRASVLTRYPEELAELQRQFTESVSRQALTQASETLQWLKARLPGQ